MASMRLFRDEWNTVAHRIVATPTGLNVLAGTALFLLVSVVWLSLHYFDLAYQRYELTAKHTSAQPT